MDASAPTAAFHLGYRRWLDGLRGVAVLLVLAYHLRLLPGGSLGVDVFFVLSGFLITTLLVEEWQRGGAISLRKFYLRRGLRLLPAFLVVLAACAATVWWFQPEEMPAVGREILVAGLYVANWPALHQTTMPRLGHTWSLSVEEQFYLLWPVLLLLMLHWGMSRRRMILMVGLGILASAVWRMGLYGGLRSLGPDKANHIMRLYCGLDTRADALLVGCLVGLLAAWHLLPTGTRFRVWSGVAALAAFVGLGYLSVYRTMDHSQYYHGLFTVVALMVAVILARFLAGPMPLISPVLESTPLVAVGRISYGLYLVHIPILHWLHPWLLQWGALAAAGLAAGLSLGAAALLYHLVERPCLRWKERWRGVEGAKDSANEVAPLRTAA